MRGDTRAVTDRIIAVLQADACDLPMTTRAVCEAAGGYLETRECVRQDWGDDGHARTCNPYVSLVACDGRHDILAISLDASQRGYQILRRLEHQGLVARLRFEAKRDVYWQWLGERLPDLTDLEAAWEASPS